MNVERLTHERVNGIKTGYWSAATKDKIIQKLAAYENTGYEPDEIHAAIAIVEGFVIRERRREKQRADKRERK